MREQKRILKMIEDGKIGKEEALKLLKALDVPPEVNRKSQLDEVYPSVVKRFFTSFYNPFAVLGNRNTLILGLVVIAVLSFSGWYGGSHFDGAIDLHPSPNMAKTGDSDSYFLILVECLIGWLSIVLCFFGIGKLVAKGKQRFTDHLGMTALARFPYIIAAFLGGSRFGAGGFLPDPSNQEEAMKLVQNAGFISIIMLLLLFFVWFVILHFFAVKEATGLSVGKSFAVLVGGTIAAEIVSKIFLVFMFNLMNLVS